MANHIPVPLSMPSMSVAKELLKARADAEEKRLQGQFDISALYYQRAERLRQELIRREN